MVGELIDALTPHRLFLGVPHRPSRLLRWRAIQALDSIETVSSGSPLVSVHVVDYKCQLYFWTLFTSH
jgi:hypothetical protein